MTEPQHAGFTAALGKYAEALELLWFQYVVGYDRQEQRALATSLSRQAYRYQATVTTGIDRVQRLLWPLWQQPLWTLLILTLLAVIVFFLIRFKRVGWRAWRIAKRPEDSKRSAIEFYERLTKILAERGVKRAPDQTPLEFAATAQWSGAVMITAAYNRVRFGSERLAVWELRQIDDLLNKAEQEE